jgi:hypothetical protein
MPFSREKYHYTAPNPPWLLFRKMLILAPLLNSSHEATAQSPVYNTVNTAIGEHFSSIRITKF